MTAAVKRSGQESLNDVDGSNIIYESGRQHEHIGIIVTTGKLGKLHVPAESGTDTLMLVKGYSYSVAGTAESYSGIALTSFHGLRTRMGEIRIITTLGTVSSEILEFYSLALEIAFEYHLHFIAGRGAAQPPRHVRLKN